MKLRTVRSWPLILLGLTAIVLAGCNGGGVAVEYAPASSCRSIDLDPVECDR